MFRLYIRGSRWGIFRNTFFCLYLHCAVIFTVLFGVSSGGQSLRLSSLVGEVWVVCYYLFLCGLLLLSLSCMEQVGIFCYIYSLANYVSINYFLVYCFIYLRSWESGVLWFLHTTEDCPPPNFNCTCKQYTSIL